MFERLVITNSVPMQRDRRWYFFFSALIIGAALVAGLITSLFSKDLSLGTDDFALVQLMAPIELPVAEPDHPEPERTPEQSALPEKKMADTPETRTQRIRATRRVNMARTDETPPAEPKGVSATPNLYKARPADMYFGLGTSDIDHNAGYRPGRLNGVGSSSGSGSGSTSGTGDSTVAKNRPVPPPPPAVKKSITRTLGVINGKAESLPKPMYPAAARAVRAEGKVRVRVLINESGRVVSANAVSGPPLLRHAAETAARQARFSPTLLSGEAVKVSGVIVYNFMV